MIIGKINENKFMQTQDNITNAPDLKIGPIFSTALKTLDSTQQAEKSLSDKAKDFLVVLSINKALKLFIETLAPKKEEPSLLSLSTTTFKVFDPEKNCFLEYRLMSAV
ncbi:MAG: hypothetical protein JSS09_07265 [Verrucomicrobia bacterium]|nr:hypothetical protein [Verrucomicrobiota bacterium]